MSETVTSTGTIEHYPYTAPRTPGQLDDTDQARVEIEQVDAELYSARCLTCGHGSRTTWFRDAMWFAFSHAVMGCREWAVRHSP